MWLNQYSIWMFSLYPLQYFSLSCLRSFHHPIQFILRIKTSWVLFPWAKEGLYLRPGLIRPWIFRYFPKQVMQLPSLTAVLIAASVLRQCCEFPMNNWLKIKIFEYVYKCFLSISATSRKWTDAPFSHL